MVDLSIATSKLNYHTVASIESIAVNSMCDYNPITMWVYYGVTIIYSNKSWIISQDVPHKKNLHNLCTCEVNGSMVRLLG